MKKNILVSIFLLLSVVSFAQSDIEKVLKGGEILVNGLSFFKGNKSSSNSKTIESLCVKNKLADKITFKIVGQDEDGTDLKKELVIQKDGKECFLELSKGIYTYEIILSNKEVFKKGEYKIDDEITITVKQE
jgi:predicted ATPase